MRNLDFPVKPHVYKYLQMHLGAEPYVLSNTGRFGRMLFQLLRRQVKGKLWQAGTRVGCTKTLALDLRNYPAQQYGLTELTDHTIYQFNDFIDETLKEELFTWISNFVNRRTTIKEVITDFMAAYDLLEEDIQFETLRKAVQRNPKLKRQRKNRQKSVVEMSQKSADLSRKNDVLSQQSGGMSRYDSIRALRQELMQLPLPSVAR